RRHSGAARALRAVDCQGDAVRRYRPLAGGGNSRARVHARGRTDGGVVCDHRWTHQDRARRFRPRGGSGRSRRQAPHTGARTAHRYLVPTLIWHNRRMLQPEALATREPLVWSTGAGADVWEIFRAASAGDVATIERLIAADPSLVRSSYLYHRPLSFAV